MPVTTFCHTVTEYGAKPGGVFDCTAAINTAIATAAAQNGGVVYLPAGVFLVTASLLITASNVLICGAGKRATIIQFAPTTDPATLFLFERTGSTILHCGLTNLTIAAGADSTRLKIAIDIHHSTHFFCQNVEVRAWVSGGTSIAVRFRGRDTGLFDHLRLDADIPVYIGSNADNDPNKDADHCWFTNSEYTANNTSKAAVLVESAAVLRNLTFENLAWVQGGFRLVDDSAPRRRSVNIRMSNIRIEGLAETAGTVSGVYAIDIQRNTNGKLVSLVLDNVLLGEGSDARYGTTLGCAWNGLRATGVIRLETSGVTYGGRFTPLTYDGRLIDTGSQWTPEDNGRAVPEHESHWARLGVTLGPRSWWNMARASNGADDEQDETLGPADYDLDPTGGTLPTQQQLVDGWSGYWITLSDAVTNQKLRLNSAAGELDPATQHVAALAVINLGSAPAATKEILNLSGDATGPRLRLNTAGKLFLTCAGVDGAVSTNVWAGQTFVAWLVINHTAASVRCRVRRLDGVTEEITVAYSAAVGNSVNKGIGAYSALVSPFTGSVRHAAWFLGGAAKQDELVVFTAMGWTA